MFDEEKTLESYGYMKVLVNDSCIARFENQIEEIKLLIKDVLGNSYIVNLKCESTWCGLESPWMSYRTEVKAASLPIRILRNRKQKT